MNGVYEDKNFNRSLWELQEFFLFSAFVAGKTAYIIRKKVEDFLSYWAEGDTPFERVRWLIDNGKLRDALKACKVGHYTRLENLLMHVVETDLDVRTCTLEDLMACHGVGPKTARFFLMFTRPGQRYAALDTHILRWLREQGHDAPKSTPTSERKYKELEEVFLGYCDTYDIEPVDLDYTIWLASCRG